ncbi:hypothetical protein [Spirosoma pomorum]
MNYSPPQVNEMIYAVKEGVGVYDNPSKSANRLLTNSENDDHKLRDWKAGEAIGPILSQDLIPNKEQTESFLKVQYWTWENQGVGIIPLFRKNVKILHEGYIAVADDGDWWVRQTHKDVVDKTTEADAKRQAILTDIKSTANVPAPLSVEKQGDDWLISFPNGYEVLYADWQKLSATDKRSNTGLKVTTAGLSGGSGKGAADGGGGSSFFTTQNMLIMAGIVVLAGVALTLYFTKKKPKK